MHLGRPPVWTANWLIFLEKKIKVRISNCLTIRKGSSFNRFLAGAFFIAAVKEYHFTSASFASEEETSLEKFCEAEPSPKKSLAQDQRRDSDGKKL